MEKFKTLREFRVLHLILIITTLITIAIAMTGCDKTKIDTTVDKGKLAELITVGKEIVSGYQEDLTEEELAFITEHCTEVGANQINKVINEQYGTQWDGFISLQTEIDKLTESGIKLSLDERIVEKDGELGVYRQNLEFDSYTEFIKLTDTEYAEINYKDTPITREEIKSDSGYELGLCDFGYYENGLLRLKFITMQEDGDTNDISNRPILNDIQFENTDIAAIQNKYTVEVSMWIQNGKIVKYEQGVVSR